MDFREYMKQLMEFEPGRMKKRIAERIETVIPDSIGEEGMLSFRTGEVTDAMSKLREEDLKKVDELNLPDDLRTFMRDTIFEVHAKLLMSLAKHSTLHYR